MKGKRTLALILAGVWIVAKTVFFQMGVASDFFDVMVMLHLFFLLVIVSLEIYKVNKSHQSSTHLFDDLKVGMRAGGYYLIITSIFAFMYYKVIDVDFLENRIKDRIEIEQTRVDENWEELQAANPELRDMTPEQYVEEAEKGARQFLSPHIMVVGGLLILLIVASFYAIASSLLIRNVLLTSHKKNINS